MSTGKSVLWTWAVMVLVITGCSQQPTPMVELKKFPLDDLEGVLTQSQSGGTLVEFDKDVSSDGKGSLRISTREPTTIQLFELGDIDIENARLLYQAKIRTQNASGQVYLDMRCHFPGKGELASQGLEAAISGNTDWTTQETPLLLQKGDNPNNVKLRLAIDGPGTVWIDDIRLLQGPLE